MELVARFGFGTRVGGASAGVMPVIPGALSFDMDFMKSAISGLVMGRSRAVFSSCVTLSRSMPSINCCRSVNLSLQGLWLNRDLYKPKMWLCTVVWSLLRVGGSLLLTYISERGLLCLVCGFLKSFAGLCGLIRSRSSSAMYVWLKRSRCSSLSCCLRSVSLFCSLLL